MQKFYENYRVLEAYYYDPQRQDFWAFVRDEPGDVCTLVTALSLPWVSPLLEIRFELFDDGLAVFHSNGDRFTEPEASLLERDRANLERQQAEAERDEALRQAELC